LELDAIAVAYPAPAGLRRVIESLSLDLAPGEIGCLLGASGCGKTTVLRAVAGFEPLCAGRILIAGDEVSSSRAMVQPERRRVGMMFQDYALFPHLTAAQNIDFGLHAWLRTQRMERVAELLALIGMPDAGSAYPHELSGGQQQRIALARALAPSPAVLLLDEPFSNLDAEIRGRLAAETRDLLNNTSTTVLMVTHDQSEAFAIADRVGVMADGQILQWDRPEVLFAHPVERRVADFIGRGDWVCGDSLGLDAGLDVRLRPGQLRLDPEGSIVAELLSLAFRGPDYAARVRFPKGEILEISLEAPIAVVSGQAIRLRLIPGVGDLLMFPRVG
jgi:iron(III) transport system ATP-binding protein